MNPIIQRMNISNPVSNLSGIVKMLKSDPDQAFNAMLNNNPQFADFYNKNKDKPIEQVAREYNIDLGAIKSILR